MDCRDLSASTQDQCTLEHIFCISDLFNFDNDSTLTTVNCLAGKPVQYEVFVKTGDVRYAGTDANVYIIFIGTNGKTSKLFLDDSKNNFERGMTECFKVCEVWVPFTSLVGFRCLDLSPGFPLHCEMLSAMHCQMMLNMHFEMM